VRFLYFDLQAGVIGSGLPLEFLERELSKLRLSGYRLEVGKVVRGGIEAVSFKVVVEEEDQPQRNLSDILEILENSDLSGKTRERAARVFRRLAEAEGKVHNLEPAKVHFHEVGSVDAIIDVTGACIGLEYFDVDRLYSSPFRLGTGQAECHHGTLPVPVPAVLELIKGFPAEFTGIPGEMVTPTGAAVLTGLVDTFSRPPLARIESVGYGAGSRNREGLPNVLRIFTGEELEGVDTDEMVVVQTNIDDMNPEIYDYVMELLFRAGAADVYLTPVQMKKNRPGICLTVLAEPVKLGEIVGILGRETTTLGVRTFTTRRYVLRRRFGRVKTEYGWIRVKEAWLGDSLRGVSPEYESAKRLARKHGVPLHEVYRAVERSAGKSDGVKDD